MNIADLTSYAVIDLDAVAANVRAIKAHVGAAQVIAVVKANAYGHGAVQIARAALDAGASRLAVARIDEGITLRQAGIDATILVMGYHVPGEAARFVEYGLTATVTSMEVARAISATAGGDRVRVHIKIDSGMGRAGIAPGDALAFVQAISALPGIEIEGIYTHFAAADSADKTFTLEQYRVFEDVLHTLEAAGYRFGLRHAANSAATLDLPSTHLDAVRIGIAMYGLRPSTEVEPMVTLRPVLSLHSHVARVRELPAGSSVGYGRTYICELPTQVALIPVGYGDGYHRALSGRGVVLIGGKRCPVIGRVSMDQITVDASEVEAREGDEVVLIGSQGEEVITAEEVAMLAGTINYEVTTSLLGRLPRVYVRGDEVVD
jgi:alanine racemase